MIPLHRLSQRKHAVGSGVTVPGIPFIRIYLGYTFAGYMTSEMIKVAMQKNYHNTKISIICLFFLSIIIQK